VSERTYNLFLIINLFLFNSTEIDSFLTGQRVPLFDQLKMDASGILRCESIYKAKLSDTLHVSYQAPKDPHPWTALIMSIALGK
jgi:hypothetical protein